MSEYLVESAWSLVALSTLEMVFPPLAGPVLPLAGVAVSRGDAQLAQTIAAATLGSTLGSFVLYAASRWFGADRVRSWLLRNSEWSRLSAEQFDSAEQKFERNAALAVFLGRCVPVLRALVSIPAGLVKMPVARFVLLSFAGNALWCSAVVAVSAQLGSRLDFLQVPSKWLQIASTVGWSAILIAAPLVWLAGRHRMAGKKASRADERLPD